MSSTNFLKLNFWKLLSNSKETFNIENVNLLSNPNPNPKNGVAYKKNVHQGNVCGYQFWQDGDIYNKEFPSTKSPDPLITWS